MANVGSRLDTYPKNFLWGVQLVCHPFAQLTLVSGVSIRDVGIVDDLAETLWCWKGRSARWTFEHAVPFTWQLWIGVSKLTHLRPKLAVCAAIQRTVGVRAATPGFFSNLAVGYSAVCQPCDSAQQVCDLCVRAGISYAQGRAAYDATKEVQIPETTPEEQEGVEVTGWCDSTGHLTTQPTTRLTFAQISEATGIPIEEVRQQLSFTSSGSS